MQFTTRPQPSGFNSTVDKDSSQTVSDLENVQDVDVLQQPLDQAVSGSTEKIPKPPDTGVKKSEPRKALHIEQVSIHHRPSKYVMSFDKLRHRTDDTHFSLFIRKNRHVIHLPYSEKAWSQLVEDQIKAADSGESSVPLEVKSVEESMWRPAQMPAGKRISAYSRLSKIRLTGEPGQRSYRHHIYRHDQD